MYQWFYQLNETGVVDKETKDMMAKPRCGFPISPIIMDIIVHVNVGDPIL